MFASLDIRCRALSHTYICVGFGILVRKQFKKESHLTVGNFDWHFIYLYVVL